METRRLILRKIRPEDYESIAAILQTHDGYSYWAVVEKKPASSWEWPDFRIANAVIVRPKIGHR